MMKVLHNLLLLTIACVLLLSVASVQGLKCWQCENADSIEQCDREGKLVRCNPIQDTCGSEIRLNGGWLLDYGIKVFKYCKQKSACGNAQIQNKKSDDWETQCSPKYPNSVCRCCCQGDGCNIGELTCLNRFKSTCPVLTVPVYGSMFCTNETQVGSHCAFHCKKGYYVDGEHITTCKENMVWTSSTPICLKIKCPNVPKLQNGSYKCNLYNLYQSVCSFECDTGYSLVGAETAVCEEDQDGSKAGKWSTKGQKCEPKSCAAKLQAPVNGGMKCSAGRKVGSICDFYCDDDYELIGGLYSKCVNSEDKDGSPYWDYEAPTCERKECEMLPSAHENGDMVCTDGKFINSACTFSCTEGYQLVGKPDLKCVSDYSYYADYMPRWDHKVPTCEKKSCPANLVAPKNGRMECNDGQNIGSICDFYCDDDYELVGGSYSKCVDSKDMNGSPHWDYETPTCERNECKELPAAPENGDMVCTDEKFINSVCKFSCADGYELVGDADLKCVSDYAYYASYMPEWDHEEPTCEKKSCPADLVAPMNGGMECTDGQNVGSICDFYCDDDHELVGGHYSKCVDSNDMKEPPYWDYEAPICERRECKELPTASENGGMVCTDEKFINSVCKFTCADGYELVGDAELKCVSDYAYYASYMPEWDNKEPTCAKKSCPADLVAPMNGRMECTDGQNVGSICDFHCDDDYELVGGLYSKCIDSKDMDESPHWDYEAPTCERRECKELPTASENGDMVCTDDKFINSVCKFSCADGYELVGDADLKCVSDYLYYGNYMPEWDHKEPTCEKNSCPADLVAPLNGRMECTDGQNIGSICDFYCDDDHELVGGLYSKCVDSEDTDKSPHWDYEAPTCERRECKELPTASENGEMVCTDEKFINSVCKFTCADGYELVGNAELKCVSDYAYYASYMPEWDNKEPTCAKKSCQADLVAPMNGRMECTDGQNVGSICDFYCDDDYELVGGLYSKCIDSKDMDESPYWDYEAPICERRECKELPAAPKNGDMACTDEKFINSVCKFSCADGYDLVGDADLKCVSDYAYYASYMPEWDHEEPTCEKKSCSANLVAPMNGRMECTDGQNVGSICDFYCDDDYKLIGGLYSKCIDGKDMNESPYWDYEAPTCERKECSAKPVVPENASMECTNGMAIGSVCTFTCDDHYDMVGLDYTTCAEIYEYGAVDWEYSSPKCVLNKCPSAPGNPDNGNVTCTDGELQGSVCAFYCEEGYELVGSMYIECTRSEYDEEPMWNYDTPVCKVRECPDLPEAPANGGVSCNDGKSLGSICTFSCDYDHKLVGAQYIKCIHLSYYEESMWDYDAPVCHKKECDGHAVAPRNGFVQCTDDKFIGSVCEFSCEQGYYVDGARKTTCKQNYDQETVSWDNIMPKCTPKECYAHPVVPENGYIKCTDRNLFGSVCEFSCKYDYELVGAQEITCSVSNKYYALEWDNSSPECVKKQCEYLPEAPLSGNMICSDGLFFDSICTFYCEDGYKMVGAMYSKCTQTSKYGYYEKPMWDYKPPICEPKRCKTPKAPTNGFVQCTDDHIVGSKCEYGCDDFHRRVGPLYTTCQETEYGGYTVHKWSNMEPPVCERISCPKLDNIENGKMTCSDDQNVNSECQFHCTDEEYELYTYYSHYPKPKYSVTCQNDSMWSKKPPCCARSCPPFAVMDLVVLLDSSSSIGASNWPYMLKFVNNIFNLFIVQPDAMNFGVVRYNSKIDKDTQIDLNDCPDDVNMLKEEVSKIPYNGEGTWTGQAMTYALENMLQPMKGNRPGVRDVVLVITDGRSQDDITGPAKALRDAGVLTFALGITPSTGKLDLDQLYGIAGSQSNLFLAKYGFDNLTPEFAREISRNICGNPCQPNSHYDNYQN